MAILNDNQSDWPSSKDTYIDEVDDPKTAKTRLRASIPNGIYKWIENMQDDLGGSLKGAAADAQTRLTNIETKHGQVIVAASDSLNKTYADYICDGTADDVQIQAAIDAMLEDGNGTVLLLPGTYTLAATIDISQTLNEDRRLRVEGYGATLISDSDPVIDVDTGAYTHVAQNGTEIAGMLIIGDAGSNSPRGDHAGTNTGIRISDSIRVLVKDVAIRHCDIGINTRHATEGYLYHFCEGIHIERCYIMCCNQGIVHSNPLYATEASTLDGSSIKDCTIIIGMIEGEGAATDACIKFERGARFERSNIHNCLLCTYYGRNHLYLNDSMATSKIEVWCEAAYSGGTGNVIYVGPYFYEGDGFVIKYVITSGEAITEVNNSSNLKIHAMNMRHFWGYGKVNARGLLTNRDNQMAGAILGESLLNAQALWLFLDGAGDVNDSSDNDYDLDVTGATWGTKGSGWGTLDFDGTNDFANTGVVMAMDGDRMVIIACEPDDAYTVSQQILFRWYYDDENYITLQINDGTNQVTLDVERGDTYTAISRVYPYAAGEVIVFGVSIESNTCKLWINGEVFETGSNAGTMNSGDGDFYIGAQYGGLSLFFDGDVFFCGVYDFVSEDIIRRLSGILMSLGCKTAPKLDVKAINTIDANDVTPSVRGGTIFRTSANGGATAITDFDDGYDGQRIVVIGGSDTNSSTMASGDYLKLSGAMTLTQYDSIELIYDKTNDDWIEISRTTYAAP